MKELSFFAIILENLPRLTKTELMTLQDAVEATLKGDAYSKYSVLEESVFDYLKRGEKLQAVKSIKDQTGLGLKESKDVVDALYIRMQDDGLIPPKSY
jgi:ribosomal protein L7/L12